MTSNAEQILKAWDEFAATVEPEGKHLDRNALRDHAADILRTIATDLETTQTEAQQLAKSKGRDGGHENTAAKIHAEVRKSEGFPVDAMITEYRHLRASVIRLWTRSGMSAPDADDIQQLIRFNEAIDQSITESVESYIDQTKRSTDLFIGILGHDIRNPLGTIGMSVQHLVRSGQLSEKAAGPISNSAIRINGLIEQLLDFTRAQTEGVMPLQRKPGDLAEQLGKVFKESQVRHPERQLRLESAGDLAGSWDEGRIGQLLSNLLGNALAYGSRTEPVTVKMWATPSEACFSVHNYGSPIPLEELGTIFQPLARGSMAGGERREQQGLGLGLYICREIVLAHGGSLTATSTEKEGTTFVVCLPKFPAA